MAEKKSWTEILMRLPEQYLELVGAFKEQAEMFHLFFSSKRQPKNFKTVCECKESSDLVLEAFYDPQFL
jgi:hypothetical protein